MADKKISELDLALQINNDAVFPFSQQTGGEDTTYKASITQLGAKVAEDQTYSNLQTTSKKLVGAINELNGKGSVETATIENTPIATFPDGADNVPLSELEVEIEPNLSGVSSVNVVVNGVNQWDEQWELGTINDSGVNATDNNKIRSKNYIPIKPSTDYFIVCPSSSKNGKCFFYDKDKTFISSAWFYGNAVTSSPSNAYYIRFGMVDAYGTTYNNDISINYPSTDTQYHAYNGTTYNISLGGTYYGGTLDVKNKTLTKTEDFTTADELVWEKHRTQNNNVYYTRSKQSVIKTPPDNNSILPDLISDYPNLATTYWEALFVNDVSGIVCSSNGLIAIALPSVTSLEDFNAIASQINIAYPLATPTVITGLSDTDIRTLLGNNNIFADSGDIEKVTYFKPGCESIARLIEAYK